MTAKRLRISLALVAALFAAPALADTYRDAGGTVIQPSVGLTCTASATAANSWTCTPSSGGGALPAGTNVVGKVGIDQTTPDTTNRVSAGTINSVCVTPTITAGTYTSGQEVGGLLTFANAFNASGRGILQSIVVNSKTKQATGAVRLYMFAANPSSTTWTDHATPAINSADVFAVRTPIDMATSYSDLGTHSVWGAAGIGQALNTGSTSLYGVLVATSALSAFGSTTDVQVCLKTLAD